MYPKDLVESYTKNRGKFTATDAEVYKRLEEIGIQGKRVLDFGCGDGRYALDFKKRGASSVIGIDINQVMFALAQRMLESQKVDDVTFLEVNGEYMPFVDNSFDIVFSNFVLHHVLNSQKALGEIYRVLDKNGFLVMTLSAYNVSPELNHLKNTKIPIRLGDINTSVVVENLLKAFSDMRGELEQVGFKIREYLSIENPNAKIDDSYPYRDRMEKVTVLAVAQKI